jgi:hypothetical protein
LRKQNNKSEKLHLNEITIFFNGTEYGGEWLAFLVRTRKILILKTGPGTSYPD